MMDLGVSERVAPLLEQVRHFIREHILPVEHEFIAQIEVDDPFVLTSRQLEILSSLKGRARDAGLWNFFLTGEEGSGLNTVEYAYLAEEMGKSRLAAEIFNCSPLTQAIWRCCISTAAKHRKSNGWNPCWRVRSVRALV
jgi:acyl-CoA dehydrogenase